MPVHLVPSRFEVDSRLLIWLGLAVVIASLVVIGFQLAEALAPMAEPTGPAQLIPH
jgi:hypothetical protein